MYVLGVADATEGKTWCGYGQVDSITQNHTSWPRLIGTCEKPDARASVLIEEALVKNFPCQDEPSVKLSPASFLCYPLTPDALNLLSGNDFFKFWVSGEQPINSGRVSARLAWRMQRRKNYGVDTIYLRR